MTGVRVVRTPTHVEREYGEEKWPAVERLVEAERWADPDIGMARLLGRVARSQWARPDPVAMHSFVFDGEMARMPLSGAFGAEQAIVLDLVADACRDETDLVVELGAGWAWHLLTVWATGGPRGATYVAAEYTEAGRRAAAKLAEVDEELDFRAVPFDYREPRLDGLGPRAHAVVFTEHSIEQIPHLTAAVFDAIRGLARTVTCLHFEPVGWQINGRDGAGSSRAVAEQHDYNRNLVEILRAEADAGRLILDFLKPDVIGINPSNSTSIIRWRSSHPAC
jgi:hypothetical protein